MLRNTFCITGLAVAAVTTLGLWVWAWSPVLANGLALTFACGFLVYLYILRFVAAFVETRRWHYSTFDLMALVVAFTVLAANRHSADGLVALGLWPWTMLVFHCRTVNGREAPSVRRTLFWAHSTYLGLAMLFTALLTHWLTTQWPRPFEPPVFVFLLVPAFAVMMTFQQSLTVNFVHPSLAAGIVVSICTAALVATLTSWVSLVHVLKRRKLG